MIERSPVDVTGARLIIVVFCQFDIWSDLCVLSGTGGSGVKTLTFTMWVIIQQFRPQRGRVIVTYHEYNLFLPRHTPGVLTTDFVDQ